MKTKSAIAFMVEHAPPNGRGLFDSFSNMAKRSRRTVLSPRVRRRLRIRHTQSVEVLRFGRSEAV